MISSPPPAEIMLHFFLKIASFRQEWSCSYIYDANVEVSSPFCLSFLSDKFSSLTQLQKQNLNINQYFMLSLLLSLDLYLTNYTLRS